MSNKKVLLTTSSFETMEKDYKDKLSHMEGQASKLFDPALMQLTEGLPRWELDLIVKEADECERALQKEISMLEKAVKNCEASGIGEEHTTEGVSKASGNTKKKAASSAVTGTTAALALSDDSDMAEAQTEVMSALRTQNQDSVVRPFQYGLGSPFTNVEEILANEYTTVDRFLTLSSLLGRLFWTTPLPDHHPITVAIQKDLKHKKEKDVKKHFQQKLQERSASIQRQERLFQLVKHPNYTVALATSEEIAAMQISGTDPITTDVSTTKKSPPPTNAPTLLSLWKKVNQHKTAMVFRKPVSDKDAPGYSERILFPMDLSLVKKMITSGTILSLQQFHHKIILICHNCVKFNGASSDYGIIARDFEKYTEDSIWNALDSVVPSAHQPSKPRFSKGAGEDPSVDMQSKKQSSSANKEHPSFKASSHSSISGSDANIKKQSSTSQTSQIAPYPEQALSSSFSGMGAAPLTFTIGQNPRSSDSASSPSPNSVSRGRGRPSKKRK